MWLGVIIIPFSVKIAIIWFLWVVECNVHLKKLPEKLWWNNPPSWFTLHHPLLLSIFCTQAQLSVKFLLMMSTSSQLVIVCLLQMRNGQDNVSVIVVNFGYHTIHPFFCFRFLKFWIDIHLLYSRVIGVVEDFAGKCKQMVHHGIHLGYQSGGDENIMLRFPQALINRLIMNVILHANLWWSFQTPLFELLSIWKKNHCKNEGGELWLLHSRYSLENRWELADFFLGPMKNVFAPP